VDLVGRPLFRTRPGAEGDHHRRPRARNRQTSVAGLSLRPSRPPATPPSAFVRKDNALVITLASDPSNGNGARNRPRLDLRRASRTNRMGVVWMLRSELVRARDRGREGQRGPPAGGPSTAKRPVTCVSRLDADLLSALRLKAGSSR